jgi:thymidylate kinase
MFTVALIGPDGAGKTTVARRLEQKLAFPVAYIYMGVNPDSSNRLLPTTRLVHALKRALGAPPDTAGPPDPQRLLAPPSPSRLARLRRSVRSTFRLINLLAEEWYRQLLTWSYLRKGSIVVFDRHFFSDYYAYDIAGAGRRQLSRRIHGLLLDKVYPKPDLVIYLDAPPEVLLARKGEGSTELLDRRRDDYLAVGRLANTFVIVDATRPIDIVTEDVAAAINAFARASRDSERRTDD